MFKRERAGQFKHKQAQLMIRPRQAALAGIQERRQALRVDLWQVPWQDPACNTHALEHSLTKSQIAFLPQINNK
jgi:hypothetical protein